MTRDILGAARLDCVPTQRVGTRVRIKVKLQPLVAEIIRSKELIIDSFSFFSFPRAAWECSTGAPRHVSARQLNGT